MKRNRNQTHYYEPKAKTAQQAAQENGAGVIEPELIQTESEEDVDDVNEE